MLTCIKDVCVDIMLSNVITLGHSTMFHILHIPCKAADEPNKIADQRFVERCTSCLSVFLSFPVSAARAVFFEASTKTIAWNRTLLIEQIWRTISDVSLFFIPVYASVYKCSLTMFLYGFHSNLDIR